ncbi:MAG: Soluble ligand binding domain protein [Segetibacter sp.]|jgi:polysaccharide export outer membrane protein|nr:Soluble ligand binding domain protein [Segetibacter sp.]
MKCRSLVFNVSIFLVVTSLLHACNSEKRLASMVYFNQQGDSTLAKVVQNAEPVIQPGDRLTIVVNATNPASAAPYNLGSAAPATGTTGSAPTTPSGYLVEEDGRIQFPQLGKIKVGGLQRKQVIDMLSASLIKYLNDPIVTVTFSNFKVTVLGEVNTPGTLNIPEGKVTLVEAIGLARDLTATGRRDNITVIREKNGQRNFGKVNLLSTDAFSSPYFVLQQNDVIYVELTKSKAATTDQTLIRNLAIGSTILTVVSSLVVLIINITR